jgi:hypothetical protein
MESTDTNENGYLGCKGRQYLINEVLTGLQDAGIPFNTDKILSLTRKVAKDVIGATGMDTITDKIWLPTEWELFGANYYSTSLGDIAETASNQGRREFYQAYADRIKYANIGGTATEVRWWMASPYYGFTYHFCLIYDGGSSNFGSANYTCGIAPAFPIG